MPRDIREPLQLICDTREQNCWAWEPQDAVVTFAGLSAGDYAMARDVQAVRGRELCAVRFSIERKSVEDFCSSVSTGWDRLQREMDRMAAMPSRVIIVEGDFVSLCFSECDGKIIPPQHSHPMLTPSFMARRIAELTMQSICVLFAGDAGMAAALALHIFRRRAELLNSEQKT